MPGRERLRLQVPAMLRFVPALELRLRKVEPACVRIDQRRHRASPSHAARSWQATAFAFPPSASKEAMLSAGLSAEHPAA